jgi:chaperonin GroEL
MKQTKVLVGEKANQAILNGVNIVYDAVKLTLGPKGGNALLFGTYGGSPRITNDGVTIAECIEPRDEFEKLAADSFKEACKRTNERAGDATTTTAVVGGFLINDILGKVETSLIGRRSGDVMKTRKTLLEDVKKVVEAIKKQSVQIKSLEDLEKVAIISVEDEQLGKTIASIVYQVGIDGFVDVQEGFRGIIEHEVIEGMRFPAKVPHKAFVTNPEKYEMVMEDVPVIVTNYALDNAIEIADVLNGILTKIQARKIAILAPSFSDQVLIEFAKAAKTNVFIYPVKVPSLRTEQFEDICAYFGAEFINKDKGRTLRSTSDSDLGAVDKMIIKDVETREDAIAIGGKGSKSDAVKKRIEDLKQSIDEAKLPVSHKNLIKRRIASLSSAVAVIRVGAISDAETKYLKLKIDDAVYACKGALEEGYVRGGGLCLKGIADSMPDSILAGALRAPYNQILENAGVDEMEIADDVIDNAKAVRLAVEHAVSVTAHLITTKIIVVEARDESPADGYNNIATQLAIKNKLTAKREGLLLEGNVESEGAYDRMVQESRM